ncbi:hypothetical protein D3C71_2077860 [compost metagenome]
MKPVTPTAFRCEKQTFRFALRSFLPIALSCPKSTLNEPMLPKSLPVARLSSLRSIVMPGGSFGAALSRASSSIPLVFTSA